MYNYVDGNPVLFLDPSGLDPGYKNKDPHRVAKDGLTFINPFRTGLPYEQGAFVIPTGDGSYTYPDPTNSRRGEPHKLYLDDLKAMCPNVQPVLILHSHGTWDPDGHDEVFSEEDIAVARGWNIPIYMIDYMGGVHRYTPNPPPHVDKYEDLGPIDRWEP